MIPLQTPRAAAALLGKSDGWCSRPSQAERFSDPAVRAAYEAAWEKHRRLREEEDRRVMAC